MKHTRSQCPTCGQVFAGTKAFDAHRVGPLGHARKKRRCLTRREMRLGGMSQNEQGWWMLSMRAREESDEKTATTH